MRKLKYQELSGISGQVSISIRFINNSSEKPNIVVFQMIPESLVGSNMTSSKGHGMHHERLVGSDPQVFERLQDVFKPRG